MLRIGIRCIIIRFLIFRRRLSLIFSLIVVIVVLLLLVSVAFVSVLARRIYILLDDFIF